MVAWRHAKPNEWGSIRILHLAVRGSQYEGNVEELSVGASASLGAPTFTRTVSSGDVFPNTCGGPFYASCADTSGRESNNSAYEAPPQ